MDVRNCFMGDKVDCDEKVSEVVAVLSWLDVWKSKQDIQPDKSLDG